MLSYKWCYFIFFYLLIASIAKLEAQSSIDLNGDGIRDLNDQILEEKIILDFPADANSNGKVNLEDFVRVKNNLGATFADKSVGDFNSSRSVTSDDYLILKRFFGVSQQDIFSEISIINRSVIELSKSWDINNNGLLEVSDMEAILALIPEARLYPIGGLTPLTYRFLRESNGELASRMAGYLQAIIRHPNNIRYDYNFILWIADINSYELLPIEIREQYLIEFVKASIKYFQIDYDKRVERLLNARFWGNLVAFLRDLNNQKVNEIVREHLINHHIIQIKGIESDNLFNLRRDAILRLWDDHRVFTYYSWDTLQNATPEGLQGNIDTINAVDFGFDIGYPYLSSSLGMIIFVDDLSLLNCDGYACTDGRLIQMTAQQYTPLQVIIHEIGHTIHNSPLLRNNWLFAWQQIELDGGGRENLEEGDFSSPYHPNEYEDFAEMVYQRGDSKNALLESALERAAIGKTVLLKKLLYWDSFDPKRDETWEFYDIFHTQDGRPSFTMGEIPVKRDSLLRLTEVNLTEKIFTITYEADGTLALVTKNSL